MMKTVVALLSLALACVAMPAASEPGSSADLEQEARALVAEFVGRLKPQLKGALQAGGPVNAIEVCSHEAPKIADALSIESGWSVKRVSLKSRNASRAVPDDWEREVLARFDERQAAGESAADINYSETSGSHYRYMQAQGVDAVCLMCHGESLTDPVTGALQEYYPDDLATGYSLGQVRGAISLGREL